MTLSWKLTESLELLKLDVGKSRKWSGFCSWLMCTAHILENPGERTHLTLKPRQLPVSLEPWTVGFLVDRTPKRSV